MKLSHIMRRAAGVLMELPPENEAAPAPSSADGDDFPELDLPSEARLPPSFAGERTQPKSIEQIVREAHGPNLDEVAVDAAQIDATRIAADSGALTSGSLDFAAIYRAASLAPSAFGAEQMLETLGSLPPELPLETRRSAVRAMLSTLGKATGATPETVVADASRKIAALASFETFIGKKTAASIEQNEREIGELEAQIAAKRQRIEKSKAELLKLTDGCVAESEKLDDVLEFFGATASSPKSVLLAANVSVVSTPAETPRE